MVWKGQMTRPGQTIVSDGGGFRRRLERLSPGLTLPSHLTSTRPILGPENGQYRGPETSTSHPARPGHLEGHSRPRVHFYDLTLLGTGPGHKVSSAGGMS